MILDRQNLVSNDQAVTATANSANIIDLGVAGVAKSFPLELYAQVTADFATLTSLTLTVTTSAAEGMGTPTTLRTTSAIAAADLVAGYKFDLGSLNGNDALLRYVRFTYTVAGSNATAGAITAGIVLDSQNSF